MEETTFNITNNFSIGLYEAVIFSRNNDFELRYLNPIILYRTVEQGLNSSDNVLIGLDGKWNVLHRFQLYGQLMLDEFRLSEIFSSRGWWANKYGIQAGLKYLNALKIDHLDVQLEYNSARPYTYAHLEMEDSYTHYNQALAHPLGWSRARARRDASATGWTESMTPTPAATRMRRGGGVVAEGGCLPANSLVGH